MNIQSINSLSVCFSLFQCLSLQPGHSCTNSIHALLIGCGKSLVIKNAKSESGRRGGGREALYACAPVDLG